MDEETRQRLERIEAILEQTAQQQAESVNSQRRLDVKLDRIAEQQAQNAEAISQLTVGLEKLRQTVNDQNSMVQNNRADIANHTSDPDAHGERI